ncbi:Tfp pilus assembly protein FimT/FimU [Thermodesulfobacteriota bacterium]
MSRRNGFTLIEVTVVLFLIGLVFFTAMPKVGNFFFQTDLKRVVRSLKATVHFLRSKSITTHKNTVLHFDLAKNSYWGNYETTDDGSERFTARPPLVPTKKLPQNIRIIDALNLNTDKMTFGVLSSTFNPKGVFEETILHLSDQNNQVFTIIINAYTGRFLIYDEYVDVEYGS